MYDFSKQVVIVTGAAGNLGTAIARAFNSAGANLVLVDRRTGRLAELIPDLAKSSDHFMAEGIDLIELNAVERMASETLQRFGQINVLVNTAGGFRAGTAVHETSLDTWDFLINLNAKTVLVSSKAIIPYMLQQGSGKIINISARRGLTGGTKMGANSASKCAVMRLTESMAAELKQQNINVNCILPGTIDTPQNRLDTPEANFNRWVPPEAIADVILFLASPAARAIHGAAIPVYGLS
jgi:NAD(P)-dependent dehydrogenase (short-subunit alcohol dehydrogenase family)